MISPDSALSRARRRLASWLMPHPGPAEMWCLRCRLNQGSTLILPRTAFNMHVRAHEDAGEGDALQILGGRMP